MKRDFVQDIKGPVLSLARQIVKERIDVIRLRRDIIRTPFGDFGDEILLFLTIIL